MSNEKRDYKNDDIIKEERQSFRLMDDYIIVHSKGNIESKSFKVPNFQTYQQHKIWVDKENCVYEVADNINNMNKGDKLLLTPHAKLRRMDELTKIMEKKFGKKLTIAIIGKKGEKLGEEELEKYFIVHKDEVLCVILE